MLDPREQLDKSKDVQEREAVVLHLPVTPMTPLPLDQINTSERFALDVVRFIR